MKMFVENVLNIIADNIIKFKDNNAFCINDVYYTYHDLGLCISKIRFSIESRFKDSNIGLVINDDLETYASIFALWMEGRSYVPLHPLQPLDRNEDIMGQIGSDTILDSSDCSRFGNFNVILTKNLPETTLYLDNFKGDDSDTAYILFTSGSTGKPKGVPISRHNLGAFVDSYFGLGYEISEDDRCLQCFDLTFDLSVGSYIIPVLKGACIYTVQPGVIKYSRIYELLEDYKLTSILMVPSTIRYLQPYFNEINLPEVRYSLFCGEALYADILNEWKKCVPNAIVDNVYGPTEDTIYCTCYRCDDSLESYNGVLSIGKAMKNVTLEIVDENDNFIEGNDKGELCLAGDQLTSGYINNPQKNKDAFFEKNGIRYYRTGDICFRNSNGNYMYVGRKDSQAKIQGFRVELSEIEFHVKTFLKGKNSVCIAFDNSQHLTELALFIETEEFDIKKLIEYLRSKLPDYMVPSKIYFESVFPVNANGKIDKVKLKTLIK